MRVPRKRLAANRPSTPISCHLHREDVASDLNLAQFGGIPFGTLLADPPWRFQNRTGKVAPEHARLSRYGTMTLEDIAALGMMA